MWKHFLFAIALSVAVGAGHAALSDENSAVSKTIELRAADGLTVTGNFYEAANPKAVILLFHQAASSKDEYKTIAPKLVEAGFSALAIDQRSGGNLFGRNETAARVKGKASYRDALADLEAALAWGLAAEKPVFVWGSSYSSSLVFELAAHHPQKIAAVLSFSPGEYLGAGTPVRDAAAKVNVPVFITAAKDAAELTAAKTIFEAVPAANKIFATPATAGVHGSSTLIDARNPSGAKQNWQAVLSFLKSAAG